MQLQERALITSIRGFTNKSRLKVNIKGGQIGIEKMYLGTVASFSFPLEVPLTNDELNIIAVLCNWKYGTLVIDAENGQGKLNPDLIYMTIDFRSIGTAS